MAAALERPEDRVAGPGGESHRLLVGDGAVGGPRRDEYGARELADPWPEIPRVGHRHELVAEDVGGHGIEPREDMRRALRRELPAYLLRLVILDGVMEMRFCGARVQLGALLT